MKQFLISVFALGVSLSGYGQELDYPNFGEGQLIKAKENNNNLTIENETYYIPIKFHLIIASAPAIGDSLFIETVLLESNERFSNANIEFFKCGGVNTIIDPSYADGRDPFAIRSNFQPTHGVSNVINMYIPNSTTQYGGYSFSGPEGQNDYSIIDNAIVFDKSQYLGGDNALPSHELGHYFGLHHPLGNPSITGLELVDGSNCETTGDFCCDTPAEYVGMCCAVLPECEYNPLFGIVTDINGDTLNPDVTNIMSNMQFNINCRDVFTTDQIERIKYYRENFVTDYFCQGSSISLNEHEKINFSIYPNPAFEDITIALPEKMDCKIEIYSITGVLLSKYSVYSSLNYTINISHLISGMYIVRTKNKEGNFESIFILE